MASYTADQVQAARAALAAFVSSQRAAYQEHFDWYRRNAAALAADARSKYAAALERENQALTRIEYVRAEFERKTAAIGLSGLGIGPVAAVPIAAAVAIVAYILGSWATAAYNNSVAARQATGNYKRTLDAVLQQKLPPSALDAAAQAAGRDSDNQNNNTLPTWLPWAVVGVVVIAGIAVVRA
ncbi:MAG: hypothetical protein ACE14L_04855 [Terriglobales bacterium]